MADEEYNGEWGPLMTDPEYTDWANYNNEWGPLMTDPEYTDWANYGGEWGPLQGDPAYSTWSNAPTTSTPATGGGTSFLDTLKQSTGLSTADLVKLGIGGLGAASSLDGQTPTGTVKVSSSRPAWYDQTAQSVLMKGMNLPDYQSFLSQPGALQRDTSLQPYMNPYVKSVLDPQLARMGEEFARSTNKLNANAAMTGAFGGSRNLIEKSLLGERYDKGANEATANAFSGAFTNAETAFNKDRTVSYDDWLNQQKAPYQQLGAMGTTLAAVKPDATTTTATTNDGGSTWDKLYGLGTQLYGLGANSGKATTPATVGV